MTDSTSAGSSKERAVLLRKLETWLESGKGKKYACARDYPGGYAAERIEECEGCLIIAAARLLKSMNAPETKPARDADHCDFPDCEQHWTLVVDQALAAMKALHEAAVPDLDHPEIPAVIQAAPFRAFVDEHARLMRIRASGAAQKASESPEQRRAAIDAAALADAHRMYEAEHGEPFSENGNPP